MQKRVENPNKAKNENKFIVKERIHFERHNNNLGNKIKSQYNFT